MSRWRPSPQCIFVIADVHGQLSSLNLILKRILPLRKQDQLIFLGDYIDRGPDSFGVVKRIIELKNLFNEQIILLKGNHEDLLFKSMDIIPCDIRFGQRSPYAVWMSNGGVECAQSYAKSIGLDPKQISSMPQHRIKEIINKEHLSFLHKETKSYYETNDYIFVHAGIDPIVPLEEQDEKLFLWDRSLFFYCKKVIEAKLELSWKKPIICGHSWLGPIINPKYMMLDCYSNGKLMCLELNSMDAFYSIHSRKRLLKV